VGHHIIPYTRPVGKNIRNENDKTVTDDIPKTFAPVLTLPD
jgi:hypothetical protein